MNQTNLNNYTERKPIFKKLPDMQGFNNSFFTFENNRWFSFVLFWFPDPLKPLVFLPYGRAEKTRAKYGRKKISEGMTHNLLKAIRSDENLEKVILSEPLTLIPYEIEMHPLRPDYNLPAKDLSIQSEIAFQERLALWLTKVKLRQPERKVVYYLGATHHYFILFWANMMAGCPFTIIHEIPPLGIRSYSASAEKMRAIIYDLEDKGIMPDLEQPDFEQWIKKIGGYSNRKFWETIQVLQKTISMPKSKHDFASQSIKVTSSRDFKKGFEDIYKILLKRSQVEA